MLSEKRIRAIVKDELKEQIRKQTIRMRVLASCNRVAERFGNPTGDSYYSKSEEIKEAIDKELKYVGKVYGIEIRSYISTRYTDILGAECKHDEYHFEVKEKDTDKWIDIDEWQGGNMNTPESDMEQAKFAREWVRAHAAKKMAKYEKKLRRAAKDFFGHPVSIAYVKPGVMFEIKGTVEKTRTAADKEKG